MADFNVQRGSTAIGDTSSSTTLTAGVDYTAPASGSAAFVRIVNVMQTGGGKTAAFNEPVEDWTVLPSYTDLTTSFTLERADTAGECVVAWELVEYVGAGGGANEMVVRDVQTVTLLASTNEASKNGSTVSGIVSDGDVVVFLLGVKASAGGDQGDEVRVITEWDSANDQPVVRRGKAGGAFANDAECRVAVVEFTGSDWTVQYVTHDYTASGTVETESITAVGALSQAMIHSHMRMGALAPNLDEVGQECWLSDTATLSFQLQSGAGIDGHQAAVWVMENPGLSVQRISGSRGTGGGDPDTWTETITAVASLATASIMGESSRCTGTGGAIDRNGVNLELTATNTVTLRTPEDGQTQTYRFEVAEWPEAAATTDGEVSEAASVRAALRGEVPESGSLRASVPSEVAAPASARVDAGGEVAEAASVRVDVERPYVADSSVAKSDGTAFSLAVPKPAGTAEGDRLVAFVATDETPTITPPSGWSLVRDDNATGRARLACYEKVAGASEPSDYTWSVSIDRFLVIGIYALRSNAGTPAIEDHAGQQGTSTTPTAPSVTSGGAERLLLFGLCTRDEHGVDHPSGMNEEWDEWAGFGPDPTDDTRNGSSAWEPVGSGATGTRSITTSTEGSDDWGAQNVLVRASTAGQVAEDASLRSALRGEVQRLSSMRAALQGEVAEDTSLRAALAGEVSDAASLRAALRGELAEAGSLLAALRGDASVDASLRAAVRGAREELASLRTALRGEAADAGSLRAALRAQREAASSMRLTLEQTGEAAAAGSVRQALRAQAEAVATMRAALLGEATATASSLIAAWAETQEAGSARIVRVDQIVRPDGVLANPDTWVREDGLTTGLELSLDEEVPDDADWIEGPVPTPLSFQQTDDPAEHGVLLACSPGTLASNPGAREMAAGGTPGGGSFNCQVSPNAVNEAGFMLETPAGSPGRAVWEAGDWTVRLRADGGSFTKWDATYVCERRSDGTFVTVVSETTRVAINGGPQTTVKTLTQASDHVPDSTASRIYVVYLFGSTSSVGRNIEVFPSLVIDSPILNQ